MKTKKEMFDEVWAIRKANWNIDKRIASLRSAGYEYKEISAKEAEKYSFACYVSASRDWNRTFGYAVIL